MQSELEQQASPRPRVYHHAEPHVCILDSLCSDDVGHAHHVIFNDTILI